MFGYATVVMSYVSPERVFAFLVNSYGTVAVFVYVLIAVARAAPARADSSAKRPSGCAYGCGAIPGSPVCTILGMLAILAAMGVIPEQRAPLLFGLISVTVLLGAYALMNWWRSSRTARAARA